ncbi:MAG TPA: hypothetical protein DCQ64_16670 [Candidatus Rokubacteria bacterium]|nr:hypothetical protein [Candidatus Rokubacteria bacterium]
MSERIPIRKIRLDGGTQSRAALDDTVIDEYAAAIMMKAEFPPADVFYDGTDYWMADGFHRLKATEKAGVARMSCTVHQGTKRDAVLFSLAANASHGLRRTNADKRRAVTLLLQDAEWSQWSDREIARRCAVGRDLVGEIRRDLSVGTDRCDLEPSDNKTPPDGEPMPPKKKRKRKVRRKGKVYEQTQPEPDVRSPDDVISGLVMKAILQIKALLEDWPEGHSYDYLVYQLRDFATNLEGTRR